MPVLPAHTDPQLPSPQRSDPLLPSDRAPGTAAFSSLTAAPGAAERSLLSQAVGSSPAAPGLAPSLLSLELVPGPGPQTPAHHTRHG